MATPGESQSNVLKIGISTLSELEEKVKAFRTINLNVKKRRFILSREEIRDSSGTPIVKKGEEFDVSKVMLLKRGHKADDTFKTFQPDEGIVIISDMSTPAGIQLSMDLVTQVMNIGGGAYEAFIDRVDSFRELSGLLQKALFPKLMIVGYITPEKVQEEAAFYNVIRRADPYLRILEVLHTGVKQRGLLAKVNHISIHAEDKESWKRFIVEIVQEYTKPYSMEER